MRYLPSIIVVIVLLAALVVADRAKIRAIEEERRHAVADLLSNVQTQIDRYVSITVKSVRQLAAKVDPSFDINQDEFEALVKDIDTGPAKIIRVELAPGFVTKLVYPAEGNQGLIGKSLLRPNVDGRTPLQNNVDRGFPPLGKVNVTKDGLTELHVRAEVREVTNDQVISRGLVHMVFQFSLFVEDQSGLLQQEDLDFIFLASPLGAERPTLSPVWQAEGNLEPISYVQRFPAFNFFFYLRLTEGWKPTAAQALTHRLWYAGLASLIFLPILLANWFAVSRGTARGHLSKTQDQMSGILKNLPGAAFTYTIPAGHKAPGPEDRMKFLNPDACREIWGVEASAVEDDIAVIRACLSSPEDAAGIAEATIRSIESMSWFEHTWSITTPEGEQKWLYARAHPTRQDDGAVKWSTIVFDNTETVENERELERQRELTFLAQKSESIGQLSGGVAHDFNNILAAVMTNLEIVRDFRHDDERSEIVDEAVDAALDATTKGADLTQNMLAFAKVAVLEPKALKLNDVIVRSIRWITRTIPENIKIETSFADDLRLIHVDEASTSSALLNLIINARDAMPDGGSITIKTQNVKITHADMDLGTGELPPGDYVEMTVADTGGGIAGSNHERVFEPFFSTKGPSEGTGLGLAMVQGFMKQSGGSVALNSNLGQGATFRLLFRAYEGAGEQEDVADLDPVMAKPSGARIMVVEDEMVFLSSLKTMLAGSGYSVRTAISGDEAWQLLRDRPDVDLVLSDVVMPGTLQGTDLARKIEEEMPNLPVILMSGYASPLKNWHDLNLRVVNQLMNKPIPKAELIEAIERALETQRVREFDLQ